MTATSRSASISRDGAQGRAESRPAPGAAMSRRLGRLLVGEGLVSEDGLADAMAEAARTGEKPCAVLVRRRLVDEEQLLDFLSRHYGVPLFAGGRLDVDPEVIRLVPPDVAREHGVVPVRLVDASLVVAVADPSNVIVLDTITRLTGLDVLPILAPVAAIQSGLSWYRTDQRPIMKDVQSEAVDLEIVLKGGEEVRQKVDVFELKESADEAPVVRLVNMVLVDAIQKGASDIHFEPFEKVFRVRYRIDGVLHEMLTPPKRLESAILSRLKIMAELDIAERRLPQDGRILLRHGGQETDVRVATSPTIWGEKAVLRLLSKAALDLQLAALGLDGKSLEEFESAIRMPYGMVLITGPTGSGKTTTLCTALRTISVPGVNIMTVEDPVEYDLMGVNQVQVNETIGRTFAGTLRSFLRLDPDVILVGEMRDLETAQISVRAALTGHLVLSTMHTNDCASTITRFIDMGVPPFLVASSLLLVAAQRLVRKVCPECREPHPTDEDALVRYGFMPTERVPAVLYRGRGCAACTGTGMKGRVAIYEVMPITPELRDMILRGASEQDLRRKTQERGMKTLRQAGLDKVLEGTTTLDELLRVTLA